MWTASARAKINLHLAVHARRPDGYHALTTVFQTIDLADTLTIVEHDGPFTLRCPGSDAPEDDSNLVVRAARALASELGRPEPAGLLVTLDKQVPTQAGLGGGSADAMAALRLLCEVWARAAGSRSAGAGRRPARLGRAVLRLGRHGARPRPRRRDHARCRRCRAWRARSSARRSACRRPTPTAGWPSRGPGARPPKRRSTRPREPRSGSSASAAAATTSSRSWRRATRRSPKRSRRCAPPARVLAMMSGSGSAVFGLFDREAEAARRARAAGGAARLARLAHRDAAREQAVERAAAGDACGRPTGCRTATSGPAGRPPRPGRGPRPPRARRSWILRVSQRTNETEQASPGAVLVRAAPLEVDGDDRRVEARADVECSPGGRSRRRLASSAVP